VIKTRNPDFDTKPRVYSPSRGLAGPELRGAYMSPQPNPEIIFCLRPCSIPFLYVRGVVVLWR